MKRIIITILSSIVVLIAIYFGYNYFLSKNNTPKTENTKNEDTKKEENEEPIVVPPVVVVPKLKIIDPDSKTRPISVMIDNESGAFPQAGLQDAYIVYEIIMEGGQSRLMAIFKDKTTSMIGPVRSARHYFVDYALENDVVFTHFGYSPQAISDIKSYGVNNISGTSSKDNSAFWREKPLSSYHNVFTSISNLTAKATSKAYRLESTAKTLLNYSVYEVDLSSLTGSKIANSVLIGYSKANYISYEYDSVNKVYKSFMRGKPHTDRVTGLQYTFKNIIVYNVKNYRLNDGSGRQGLNNIGSGEGYYISDGYAMPIKWTKTAKETQTIYTDYNGVEIKVNDGNTFINIQPTGQTLTIQ